MTGRSRQSILDCDFSRPEAIRRLVDLGLNAAKKGGKHGALNVPFIPAAPRRDTLARCRLLAVDSLVAAPTALAHVVGAVALAHEKARHVCRWRASYISPAFFVSAKETAHGAVD